MNAPPALRAARPAGRRRAAFTLIELLMVLAILGVLLTIVIANVLDVIGTGRAETLSATVGHIREVITYKAAINEGPMAPSGYPAAVDPTWFNRGVLPTHTWTQRAMIVDNVDAGDAAFYPAVKTFDLANPFIPNAWYNTANGRFCALVADSGDPADDLDQFNIVNDGNATTLAQTSR